MATHANRALTSGAIAVGCMVLAVISALSLPFLVVKVTGFSFGLEGNVGLWDLRSSVKNFYSGYTLGGLYGLHMAPLITAAFWVAGIGLTLRGDRGLGLATVHVGSVAGLLGGMALAFDLYSLQPTPGSGLSISLGIGNWTTMLAIIGVVVATLNYGRELRLAHHAQASQAIKARVVTPRQPEPVVEPEPEPELAFVTPAPSAPAPDQAAQILGQFVPAEPSESDE